MKSRSQTLFLVSCLSLGMEVVSFAPVVASHALAREIAIAPEKNPPGDIPDNQVFVPHQSPLGFSIKVPEGWSRVERADGARFSDKYNIIDLAVSKADQERRIVRQHSQYRREMTQR